ncbi:MAG TPA: hypothetical protein VHB79_18665 [Polyangiaceae bacterium]|nr:hypothetical protein [Polyangiaceae bacterium]
MRVHLPALLALASATSYVACGSSDASKTVPEAAGAGGEGGESTSSSGGSSNVAGSKNSGGSLNMVGGQAGESSGGAAASGLGGASGGDSGMLGGAAGSEAAGAGSGGEGPVDMSLPAACPGVIGDYTLKVGTDGADHYALADLNGKNLIFGLAGDDVFDRDTTGEDCLLGGPGDDDLTSSGEFATYLFGGPGADTFHLATTYDEFHVQDMESADTIALLQSAYPFLVGQPGDTIAATQLYSLAGYSTGAASIPAGEGAALVYDPNNGLLWQDTDRGDNTTGQKQIGDIANYSSYTFDADDFVLE